MLVTVFNKPRVLQKLVDEVNMQGSKLHALGFNRVQNLGENKR